ncbi:hypothetical protein GGX14DRAFT_446529, partial [Mycena pura]
RWATVGRCWWCPPSRRRRATVAGLAWARWTGPERRRSGSRGARGGAGARRARVRRGSPFGVWVPLRAVRVGARKASRRRRRCADWSDLEWVKGGRGSACGGGGSGASVCGYAGWVCGSRTGAVAAALRDVACLCPSASLAAGDLLPGGFDDTCCGSGLAWRTRGAGCRRAMGVELVVELVVGDVAAT